MSNNIKQLFCSPAQHQKGRRERIHLPIMHTLFPDPNLTLPAAQQALGSPVWTLPWMKARMKNEENQDDAVGPN